MIPFRKALDLTLAAVQVMPVEKTRIESAHGRVLRQEISADRALPPHDSVMLDGYAVRAADLDEKRTFRIVGSAPAGEAKATLPQERCVCLEIMTGAPLPAGADCIVPVEQTMRVGDSSMTVAVDFETKSGSFIHHTGSDAQEGDLLLEAGILLGSCEIGVAASCGATVLQVSKLPHISIIPTGDELVAADAVPAPHQIRQSNGHAIRAALSHDGYASSLADPLNDDAHADDLREILENNDWLIFTGAVSKGARDFLPRLLGELDCTCIFHGVAQRPGKPAGFWLGPKGQAIMALPGNPVSALTGLHAFVLPALAVASGLSRHAPRLVIPAAPFSALHDMTMHLPVSLDDAGRAHAATVGNSGDFIGLLKSDGFVTLPPRGTIQAAYPFTPWR